MIVGDDNRLDLPAANSGAFLGRVREVLMGYLGRQGSPLDRGMTLRDLREVGVVEVCDGWPMRPGLAAPLRPGPKVAPPYEPDLTPPPTPTGFVATAAISNILVEHAAPVYTAGHGHLRTRLYGKTWTSGPLPLFTDAVELAQFSGAVHAHATNPATRWHLWIKWESVDGVLSLAPAGGTNGLAVTTAQDVSTLLAALSGQITQSQLHAALGARIDLIDGADTVPGSVAQRVAAEAALRAEQGAAESRQRVDQVQQMAEAVLRNALATDQERQERGAEVAVARTELFTKIVDGLSAEAGERTILAAQLRGAYGGTDINAVTSGLFYSERIARSTAVDALALQITLLSAGVGEQFDWARIWYFDTGVEGWGGNGAPTAAGGFLRPANAGSGAYVTSPAGLNIDGAKYKQVRLRVRRVGAPTFAGYLWWAAAGQDWDASRRAAINAPSFDANGLTVITLNMTWTGTIDRVRLDLSDAQASADYFEVDWFAIGRPSPGASTAQLLAEESARATADTAEAAQRETLSAVILGQANPAGLTLGNLTSGLLREEREARTTAVGAVVQDVSTLQASVTALNGNVGTLTSSVGTLSQAVATQESTSAAVSRELVSVQRAAEQDGESILRAVLAGEKNKDVASGDLAVAKEELKTRIDAGLLAEALQRLTLAAQVAQNAAAIQEEQTARATAIAAEASARTALAARVTTAEGGISTNAAAIQTEASTRATADSAMAGQISTLQASVGANTAAIQTEATTRATQTGELYAQYTVKTDVAGLVSGYGLASAANNAAPYSMFGVRANAFFVAPPATASATAPTADLYDGYTWLDTSVTPNVTRYRSGSQWVTTPPVLPFSVQTTPVTVNGVAVPPGVYMLDAFIKNGTITNAKIGNLAVDDEKVASLSAAKVTFGEMSGERIQVRSLDVNRLKTGTLLATETITANDGTGGSIVIYGSGRIEADGALRRTVMDSGNVLTYLKVPSVGEVPYQSLAHVEVGVCANNTPVVIPGYFASQPRVIVSPASLGVYNKTYSAQSQTLVCAPNSISETSSGSRRWQFTPAATLSLLGAEATTVINQDSGLSASDSFTSSTYTAPANTDRLTVQMQFTSVRGTGTSGAYYYRQITWYVDYSTDGVTWTLAGATTTVAVGATISQSVSSTLVVNLPSAQAWKWRTRAVASDAGGTFSVGSTQYETATDSVSRSGNVVASTSSSYVAQSYTPSYSLPSGWEITAVNLTLTYSYNVQAGTLSTARVDITGWKSHQVGANSSAAQNNVTHSWSSTSVSTQISATADPYAFGFASASITAHSLSGTVQRRRAITNSTTPSNSYAVGSVTTRLAGAVVLAEGSLNWMAVGA